MQRWPNIAVFLSAALFIAPAAAQQVGTATAVNPTSESTPPGSGTITLTVGAHIVHKERIHTTPTGTVQLAFLDTSTLSIAPNSSLLIDEYVYDPKSGSGHMLTNLTEGALRFVGGQLSHRGDASITTSSANIGIRGGTVTVSVGKFGTKVINHFGVITITNSTGTFFLRRSDFGALIRNSTTPVQDLGRIHNAEVAYYQAYAMSKMNETGGVAGFTGGHIGHCGLGSAQSTNCPQTPWMPADGGEFDATQILTNATNLGSGQNNPPPPPRPPRGR
jgi:hypothetical protein